LGGRDAEWLIWVLFDSCEAHGDIESSPPAPWH
jgi:hypothetical protein